MAPTVVYVAGSPRSGTTLLARLLGTFRGCVTIGELREIWDRSFARNWPCSCGEPVDGCPFWSPVIERWKNSADVDIVGGLQARNSLRTRSMGKTIREAKRGGSDRLRRYVAQVDALYRAISEVADSRTIIDSSKAPADALALALYSSLDIRVVHLVRDPRGIVQSWSRRKPDPSTPGGSTTLRGGPKATAMWLLTNFQLARHAKTLNGTTVVRYEGLCSNPATQVPAIGRSLGLEPGHVDFGEGSISLPLGHTLSGGRMRFDSGPIQITPDEEWRNHLPAWKARIVHTATWPLLRSLGY